MGKNEAKIKLKELDIKKNRSLEDVIHAASKLTIAIGVVASILLFITYLILRG